MSEYWKSTPSYWCKFCSIYVKETPIERKNHEASIKHQNNIQRSLRELHKGKEREERDKQRAKAEVARLNGLVDGTKSTSAGGGKILGATTLPAPTAPPKLSSSAQRKAHAEQLAALGVELPEELKREVTGVGGWHVVSERVVEEDRSEDRSLADIVKQEADNKEDAKYESAGSRGVHKRKMEDEEDAANVVRKRKVWGSSLKAYPGSSNEDGGEGDLDALLSGVKKKGPPQPTAETMTDGSDADDEKDVKQEDDVDSEKPMSTIPDIDTSTTDVGAASVKSEAEGEAVAPIVFKKRKGKK